MQRVINSRNILTRTSKLQFKAYQQPWVSSICPYHICNASVQKNVLTKYSITSLTFIRCISDKNDVGVVDSTISLSPPPTPSLNDAKLLNSDTGVADHLLSSPPVPSSTPFLNDPLGPDPALFNPDIVLNSLGEPTLASLGLAQGWGPSSCVQWLLENIHVSYQLEWWQVLPIAAVILRCITFPFTVYNRKNTGKNHPMLKLQSMQATNAALQVARAKNDIMNMIILQNEVLDMKKNLSIKPFLLGFLPMLGPAVVFLAMYRGLKAMAYLPVASLQVGGIAWFTDLTLPDPYFALPALAMITLMINLEAGVDAIAAGTLGGKQKWIIRAIPAIGFLYIMNMPTALSLYWLASNIIGLGQATFLRHHKIREAFGIPEMPKLTSPQTVREKVGPIKQFKSNLANQRILKEIELRERNDATNWEKAGKGVIPKTFAENPKIAKTDPHIKQKLKEVLNSRK